MYKNFFAFHYIIHILFFYMFCPDGKKQVLILNSYHHGLSWTDNTVKGIKEALKSLEKDIEYYIEYMDTKRFSPPK